MRPSCWLAIEWNRGVDIEVRIQLKHIQICVLEERWREEK